MEQPIEYSGGLLAAPAEMRYFDFFRSRRGDSDFPSGGGPLLILSDRQGPLIRAEKLAPAEGREVEGRPLRGVFEPGDAWLSTRDLVRIDQDGDGWADGWSEQSKGRIVREGQACRLVLEGANVSTVD